MAPHPRRDPMPAVDLRRRVRRITAASAGIAALAAAGLTVNLAWATDDPAASSSSTTGQAGTAPSQTTQVSTARSATSTVATTPRAPTAQVPEEQAEGDVQAPSTQQNAITTPPPRAQSPLAAPQQAPLVGGGRTHTQSGGS